MRGKTMPEPMQVLASDPEIALNGFLCPAHVSTIIGARAYEPIVQKYHLPCVVAGFEPLDILQGVFLLLRQIERHEAKVENEYSRVATYDGNAAAQKLMAEIFEPCDAVWRGIGTIPRSGLKILKTYEDFDTEVKFVKAIHELPSPPNQQQSACRCGDVLKGKIIPPECTLFGKLCSPQNPIGPCMVSSEGSCAAYFRYQ
jgi:hydrogenase expression/formation protein HypD